MIEFKLPDIGEGIAEGEIVQWLVSEGDSVDEHQPVVEVMTDKATVEVPAPAKGKIAKRLVSEGDTVPVGDVIFHLDESEGGGNGSSGDSEAKSKSKSKSESKSDSDSDSSKSGGEKRTKKKKAKKKSSRKKASKKKQKASGSSGGGKTIEFKLPDIGEGIAEGEIVQWLVSEGDSVDEHQPVVEVMTDKATVEVPAPASGTVTKQVASEGDTVPVGDVLFHLETGAAEAETEDEDDVDEGADAEAEDEEYEDAAEDDEEEDSEEGDSERARRSSADGKVLAVPSARRVARELGVDLSEVEGTGRNGVVRRADVEAYAESGDAEAPAKKERAAAPRKAAPPTAPAPIRGPEAPTRTERDAEPIPYLGEEERTPYRGIRRKIGEAMTRSMHTAAHFTVVEEIDVTELVAARAKAKELGKKHGVNVTYMPFIMKAVANGLARYRSLNGHLDEDAGEIVHPPHVNIGIATDTPNGLVVPVVPNVESKGMLHLAAELADLAQRTREGKVKPDELRGSTFTITNAGNIGGTLATPIINFPDIAILGVHRIVKRPGIVETPDGEEIAVRHYMNLSCSVDHRLADGADAARFLAWMRTILEDPALLSL